MKVEVNKLIKGIYYVIMHIVQKVVSNAHFLLVTCCEEYLYLTDKEPEAQRH